MSVRLLFVLLLSAYMGMGAVSAHAGRAFLLARDIHQWLDFDYRYDYSAIESGADDTLSFQNTRLENSYHFDTTYALLRPKLLMGRLEMDAGFDGEWQKNDAQGSDSSATPALEYRLDGTLLKDENYPVDFNSFYKKDFMDRVFAKNYNVDSRGEGLGVSYKNPFLPTRLTYTQSNSETSGLSNDRTSTSQNILINSTHQYKNLSSTSLNVMKGKFESQSSMQDGQDMTTETTSFMGNNTLNLDTPDLRRSLDSQYSYSDSKSEYGTYGDRIEDWNVNSIWAERLTWQLGRALDSGLDYRDSFYESRTTEQKSQMANGWFRHRLFDNFATTVRIGDREVNFLQGVENEWFGNIDFNYTRNLPKACYLTLGLNNSYGVTDRNLESDTLQVVDYSFLFDATRFNYLEDYDILIDTIVVRNKERTLVYDEGADYTVEKIGRQIRIQIPRGSAINNGDTLSIDYNYITNADIKYGSKASSLYTSVSLFDNSYRLAGQLSRSSQDLLAGEDLTVSLTDSTAYMVSLEKNITFFTFKGEYGDNDSTTDKYHYWQPSVEYSQAYYQYYMTARLQGRQTEYDEVSYGGVTSPAGSERSLTAQASLRRLLSSMPGAMWETRADYLLLNGRGNEETEVSLNSAFQVSLGKSQIRLEGEVTLTDNNGQQFQEAFLWLKFRRFI